MTVTTQEDLKSIYLNRQAQLGSILESARLDVLALNPGATMAYLTGLHFHLMERPTVILFLPGREPFLVLPDLEMLKVKDLPYPVQTFSYGDNPATWEDAFRKAAKAANLDGLQVGIEPNQLRVLELSFLQKAAPQAQFISAGDRLASLRLFKDAGEIANIQKAVDIAQKAFLETLPFIHAGATEREVASELSLQLLRAGSDSQLAFTPIVSTGPNSANPHATPTERKLAEGDLLVIDWGAAYNGYISDLTRTVAVGQVEPEFEKIARIVAEANGAGRAAARPGIPAGQVDRAARQVIDRAGYGKYFTHRVGHGIGMETHEEPYMFAENQLILVKGMAFTVEPGIYLPNRGGVRIEDNVVITADGSKTLSDLPRDLYRVK